MNSLKRKRHEYENDNYELHKKQKSILDQHDIYNLSDQKNVMTIERFLKQKIENEKNKMSYVS